MCIRGVTVSIKFVSARMYVCMYVCMYVWESISHSAYMLRYVIMITGWPRSPQDVQALPLSRKGKAAGR